MGFREEIIGGDLTKLAARLKKKPNLKKNLPGGFVPPLTLALEKKQWAAAKLLLDEGAPPGPSLASCAARPLKAGLAFLLDEGVDPNLPPGALHYAGWSDQPDCARLLIGAGADLDQRNDAGNTPLMSAADQAATRSAKVLLDAGADPAGATLAAAGNHGGPVLRALNKRGLLDVSEVDDKGWTPLHRAASEDREKSVVLLIKAGADLAASTTKKSASRDFGYKWPKGGTPLHSASSTGAARAIAALLTAGADVEARDKDGNTPLHIAALNDEGDTVTQLLAAEADPLVVNKWGWTPLHFAALGRACWDLLVKRSDLAAKTTKEWKAYGRTKHAAGRSAKQLR